MKAGVDSLWHFDWQRSESGKLLLAGVDEAGRGSWAGPVVAAAVVLGPDWPGGDLDDSKRLSAGRRERLFATIRSQAMAWRACAVSPAEIDRTHILAATLRAMARAVARIQPTPDLVLIDGNQAPPLPNRVETIVGGDASSASVAAASIVAKVVRDRLMIAWDRHFPGYGFAAHKGYGVTEHRNALVELGPCHLHRRSYRPVANLAQGSFWNETR